jgi:lipopolysaccharide export system permease protein
VILDRYIVREIGKPLGVVCAVLIATFMTYISARFLADAADGLLPPRTVLALVLLRTGIAMEVLLPITLFLSVVRGLGRLHTDAEMIAITAAGVPPARVVRAVLGVALVVGLIVGVLSLLVRPWAYEQTYRLRAQAAVEFDVRRLDAGRFYEKQRGDHVVFAERYNREQDQLENVFVHSEENGAVKVVYARRASQRVDRTGQRLLVAHDGHYYQLQVGDGGADRTATFGRAEIPLGDDREVTLEYRRKSAATVELARSTGRSDIAELHWRLSLPVATVLLALLAVALSRTSPRRGPNARFGVAVLVYAAYYNLKALAKTLVENGTVPPFPGLLWVDAALLLLVVLMLRHLLRGARWTEP